MNLLWIALRDLISWAASLIMKTHAQETILLNIVIGIKCVL
jgi:uncharacterized membrane protein YeaQ/YmgE (transglycosylase-associated protein family)